jgi:HKD family nuclease
MTRVSQDPTHPGTTLDAIRDEADPSVERIRLAVAYVTRGGVRLLVNALRPRLGAAWPNIAKAIVTSFDFGMTDPAALVELQSEGFSVSISDPTVMHRPLMRPVSAFHPKIYSLSTPVEHRYVVGSANLTDRGLTINSELAEVVHVATPDLDFEEWWAALAASATTLTPAIRADYAARRTVTTVVRPHEVGDPPLVTASFPAPPASAPTGTFEAAVDSGLDPTAYENFWIEAGSMSSGGSHNQLELPRYGQLFFFGPGFTLYDNAHHEIGRPTLLGIGATWTDRRLTWHGNNRMERINLPTQAQGGHAYPGTAVLFRRTPLGFELRIAAWTSPIALSWREASTLNGTVFRLGAASTRVCGLF